MLFFSTVREARAKASTFKSHMSFGESGRGNFRVRGAFHCSEGGASTLGRCRENSAKGREVFLSLRGVAVLKKTCNGPVKKFLGTENPSGSD